MESCSAQSAGPSLDALNGWVLDVAVSIAVRCPTVGCNVTKISSGIAIQFSRQMSVDDDHETSKAIKAHGRWEVGKRADGN